MSSGDETKCLLTPQSQESVRVSFILGRSDGEVSVSEAGDQRGDSQRLDSSDSVQDEGPLTARSDGAQTARSPSPTPESSFRNCPLIYSEPALFCDSIPTLPASAISESALPSLLLRHQADSGIASINDNNAEGDIDDDPAKDSDVFISTPKASICLSEMSFATATGRNGHKTSFSTREIREQHTRMQEKYRPTRQRHFTDPVDFEGILNIIGGCSWWQIWVYVLISMQQIPHAMFNLNVVYMMYNPEHWCQVPGFVNTTSDGYLWSLDDAMNTTIIFPRTSHSQLDDEVYHDQCHFFDRGQSRFEELRKMPLEEAIAAVENEEVIVSKCTAWDYKKDVMETTIVTDWNLVCDDNIKRGHAHLFYSFGFLVGCLLGGFASDSFGRKPTVIGFGILSSMFGVFLPYTTYFPMFLFIRFCSAVCNEAADLAAYILCMEITGVRYRAMIGSLLQAPWAVGYALLALLAYFCKSWKMIQAIAAALHFLAMLMLCTLPESPRWLIVSNRVSEAEEVIRKACRTPPFPFSLCRANKGSLPSDLELVRHRETSRWVRDQNKRVTLMDVFKVGEMRMRSLIVCVVFMATALVYYGIVIALSDQSAPGRVFFSGNFFVNNAIAGAIELPTLISCVYLMKFGRKRAQMITLISAGLFLIIALLAVVGKSYMVALIFMMLGKICVQGALNILYIFSSELYPTVVRNSAVGLNSMIARFGSGVSSYIAMLSDVTLPIVPMMIFAVFSLFAGMLVSLLPETNGLPLPETIDDAVTLLKNEKGAQCYGFAVGVNKSMSLLDEAVNVGNSEEPERSISTVRRDTDPLPATGGRRSCSAMSGSVESRTPSQTSAFVVNRKTGAAIMRPADAVRAGSAPQYYKTSVSDSIFQDLASISIPERLPEPFGEDR